MIFEKIKKTDREEFIKMGTEFYSSPAVMHSIPVSHFEKTFDVLIGGSPLADCYIFREGDEVCGYALLALTYSNEAGGKVVWIEEVYVREQYRSKGITGSFFEMLPTLYPDAARLRLEIEPDNERAAQLYRRKGFDVLVYSQMYREIGRKA